MPTLRTVRVAEVLRKELAACMSKARDPEKGVLVTISSVELPPDMRQAFIYVSTLEPGDKPKVIEWVSRHRREWQSTVGRRLGIKFTPQLVFRFDDAIERGDRVMEILTKLELPKPSEEEPPA